MLMPFFTIALNMNGTYDGTNFTHVA